jgi:hypothetical protein
MAACRWCKDHPGEYHGLFEITPCPECKGTKVAPAIPVTWINQTRVPDWTHPGYYKRAVYLGVDPCKTAAPIGSPYRCTRPKAHDGNFHAYHDASGAQLAVWQA